jgi:3-oxoacyl-[acyl-carrier protein] reductase
VLDVNLFGTVHCCAAVAPMMKRHGKGSIVTVSSEAGLLPSVDGGYAHYGVAKAAVAMYTRYLARELGPYGIRANCIAPGPIGTPRLMRRFEETGVDQIAAQYPLRRLGRVEDCAAAVEFLADDARSGWISSRVIQIDGGGVECWKV